MYISLWFGTMEIPQYVWKIFDTTHNQFDCVTHGKEFLWYRQDLTCQHTLTCNITIIKVWASKSLSLFCYLKITIFFLLEEGEGRFSCLIICIYMCSHTDSTYVHSSVLKHSSLYGSIFDIFFILKVWLWNVFAQKKTNYGVYSSTSYAQTSI